MDITYRFSGIRKNTRALVEHSYFQRFIVALIIFNAIALGCDTVPSIMARYDAQLDFADQFVMGVFVLELVLRIIAYRGDFFRDPWSLFDLIIVGSALLPHSDVLGVLRILRVLRLLRLVALMPSLRMIVGSLLSALPGLGSVTLLLSIIMYTGAVITTKLFGVDSPKQFGDLGASLFSLLQVTTLDGWPDMARAAMKTSPYAWVFFFGFIFLTSFTVMNLFVGVMVGTMETKLAEDKAEKDRIRQERVAAGLEAAPVAPVSPEMVLLLSEIRLLHTEITDMRTALSAVVN